MEPPARQLRRHVWVSGRVQGVGYRASCAYRAQMAGVSGWVRNLPDGRVEAVFEGPPPAVEAMVEWCRQGPRGAAVEGVRALDEQPGEAGAGAGAGAASGSGSGSGERDGSRGGGATFSVR